MALVGRPPALTSALVADACVALAKNDAMEAAARLCEAPLIGEDAEGDAVVVDAVAAAALVAAAEDLPWCDEDDRYDTQPVFDRGQYIGWQTPKVAAALDKDREGLGPTGRYCLLSGEGPKIADRFKPRSQEDEWHLPHLDDLRERHESRRDYWLEEGLERFAEHRDRITELTDAAHDAHERARWDRDERAHNRAVAMDVFAEKEREDWAKMEEELAHLLDRDRLAERGQSDLAISSAEERMRWDMEERRKRMAEAAARA